MASLISQAFREFFSHQLVMTYNLFYNYNIHDLSQSSNKSPGSSLECELMKTGSATGPPEHPLNSKTLNTPY